MIDSSDHRVILVATGNPAKAREIIEILSQPPASGTTRTNYNWKTLTDLGARVPEPEETENTFLLNAILKAKYYSRHFGVMTLADDSGLEVDVLGGAPGVLSARYAGLSEALPRSERDAANNRKLIQQLRGIPPERRTARFRCALALADGDRILGTAEGTIEGRIIDEPQGVNGFGYDPYFLVPEFGKTTAELAPDQKNRISHRGRALLVMRERIAGMTA